MSTAPDRTDEHTPLVKASNDEFEDDPSEFLPALLICVLFSFSIQSVTNTQSLVSSQLDYVSDGPWFFLLVQSVPIIAGTILSLLSTQYDDAFDNKFGIAKTMYFRIIITGIVTICLAVGIVFLEGGVAQVTLGFFCSFCAVGAQLATFQLVVVLDPRWQAGASTALVLASIVPITTISLVGTDVHSHWTPKQRILVFAPPVAFTLLSIAVLAVFWPKDAELTETDSLHSIEEDPAITRDSDTRRPSRRSDTRRSIDQGLTEGLKRLSTPRGGIHGSDTTPIVEEESKSSAKSWPPFPYWFVSVAGFLNGVMYCMQPLVALTPGSGEKSILIIARFWGEIVGQTLGALLVFIGLATANYGSVAFFVVLTLGRIASLFWLMPMILRGSLPPYHMFWFRATENLLWCTGTAIVVIATPAALRRAVSRTDMFVHFAGALAGVAVAAAFVHLQTRRADALSFSLMSGLLRSENSVFLQPPR